MSTQDVTLQIVFVSADSDNPDPATVDEIGRSIARGLRSRGYTVQPSYTGMKGGTFYDVALHLSQAIQDNNELLSALIKLATPILDYLLDSWEERRKEQQTEPPQPLDITLTIDEASVTMTPPQRESDEELLERLLLAEPGLPAMVTPHSTVTITTQVPSPPPRQRR